MNIATELYALEEKLLTSDFRRNREAVSELRELRRRMRQIYWVLLIGPPCLAVIGWLMTRGWIAAMMGSRPTPRIALWKKYDFWFILIFLYIVMFTAALIEHKL